MQTSQIPTERFARNETFHCATDANPSRILSNGTRVETAIDSGKAVRCWIIHPDCAAFDRSYKIVSFDCPPGSGSDDIVVSIQNRNEAALGLIAKSRIERARDPRSFRYPHLTPSLHIVANNIGEAILK
jgi:hypothetical protein